MRVARCGGALLLLSSLSSVRAHTVLFGTGPNDDPARPNQVGNGVKLTPFAAAGLTANSGCGGSLNNDPGVQRPTSAYRPGDILKVTWQLTIPHPADIIDTGIRVAMHFSPADSFGNNVRPPPWVACASLGPLWLTRSSVSALGLRYWPVPSRATLLSARSTSGRSRRPTRRRSLSTRPS